VLPEDDDYETVAGLVADRLARFPEVGASVQVEAIDLERRPQIVTLRVLRMDGLRVDRVRLEHAPAPDDEPS
jgi:CBS domain containing-hemolysin-like protein